MSAVVAEDSEIAELREQARQLVGIAYRLSVELDRTVDDLQDFAHKATMSVDARDPSADPYHGSERRRGGPE